MHIYKKINTIVHVKLLIYVYTNNIIKGLILLNNHRPKHIKIKNYLHIIYKFLLINFYNQT